VCLWLVFHVLMLSVCLVPVGHGPFVAAYGPATKFQALQAFSVLMFLMGPIISTWAPFELIRSVALCRVASRENFALVTSNCLSANSPLLC
jgi:hypothetical protein